jgi:hypothetical protein
VAAVKSGPKIAASQGIGCPRIPDVSAKATQNILNLIGEIAVCGCQTPPPGNELKGLGRVGIARIERLPVAFGGLIEAILSTHTVEHGGALPKAPYDTLVFTDC